MDELEKIFGNNSQIDNMTYNDTKDDINLDRMSNTYRKGYRTQPPSNNQQDTLRDSISHSTLYSPEKKEHMLYLADLYINNLQENLFKTQFDLVKDYPTTTIDEWNDFLRDTIVAKYIKKHKNTLLKITAEDNLASPTAKNKRDNLTLLEKIQEEEKQDAKKNIVIMWLGNNYDE